VTTGFVIRAFKFTHSSWATGVEGSIKQIKRRQTIAPYKTVVRLGERASKKDSSEFLDVNP